MTAMKKRIQLACISINPADLIKKDADLSLEIKNLELTKSYMLKKKKLNNITVILGSPSITKQPSGEKVKQRIIITVVLSMMASIFVVFFFDYIERMKMRNIEKNKY
jgi:hypothetical protein